MKKPTLGIHEYFTVPVGTVISLITCNADGDPESFVDHKVILLTDVCVSAANDVDQNKLHVIASKPRCT